MVSKSIFIIVIFSSPNSTPNITAKFSIKHVSQITLSSESFRVLHCIQSKGHNLLNVLQGPTGFYFPVISLASVPTPLHFLQPLNQSTLQPFFLSLECAKDTPFLDLCRLFHVPGGHNPQTANTLASFRTLFKCHHFVRPLLGPQYFRNLPSPCYVCAVLFFMALFTFYYLFVSLSVMEVWVSSGLLQD